MYIKMRLIRYYHSQYEATICVKDANAVYVLVSLYTNRKKIMY